VSDQISSLPDQRSCCRISLQPEDSDFEISYLDHSHPDRVPFHPHLYLALEAVQLGYWQLDLHSRQLTISPQCRAQYGWDPDQNITLAMLLERIHPEDREQVSKAVGAVNRLNLNFAVEYRVYLQDRQWCWKLSRGVALTDLEGEPCQIVGVTIDISDRKQLELQLQQRMEREKLLNQMVRAIQSSLELPTLFEMAMRGARQVLQAAQATLYQYLPEAEKWVGLAGDGEWVDLPRILNFQAPEGSRVIDHLQRQQVFCLPTLAQATNSSPGPGVESTPTGDREDRLGPWLVVPIAHQGQLWGGLSLRRLTTDPAYQPDEIELAVAFADHLGVAIQQAELYRRLQQTNAELTYQLQVRNREIQQAYDYEVLLQLITEEIRTSLDEQKILETAAQELATSLNLCNCAISLYDFERQVSVLAVDYLANKGIRRFPLEIPFAEFTDILNQLRQGEVCHFSNFHHRYWPNHDRYTLLIVPICDPVNPTEADGQLLGEICGSRPPGWVFTRREQSLIKGVASHLAIGICQARLYKTIQQQVQQLQDLNQLKDEFLHMVSHEMRTPLTNMKLATSFLSRANLTEQEKRYLQILQTETQREIDLVNDLLDLQAIESGSKTVILSCLSCQEFIEKISAPFLLRAREQGQYFQVQLDPGLQPIRTDEGLLSRVVNELLNNACKYTPVGEAIQLRVEQTVQNGTSGWLITVRNTGVEIPAEALPRLFDKFYRVTHLDRRNVGGTGLGLPLARKAMELLKGSLTVESSQNQVVFYVWCPYLNG
ncbi:MAG: GAF domain-containing protein, partial [Thermostichus sp. DG_1_6_bins_120]